MKSVIILISSFAIMCVRGESLERNALRIVYTCMLSLSRVDMKHGQGTHTWPDGKKFKGELEKSKMHGKGVYFWSDGRRTKETLWMTIVMEKLFCSGETKNLRSDLVLAA
jgi:hypothetical protein